MAQKRYELMVDVETFGIRPSTAIMSIGAVFFDLESASLSHEYYTAVDADYQISGMHRTIDSATLKWWIKNSAAGSTSNPFAEDGKHISVAMKDFTEFILMNCKSKSSLYVWGNGSGFDVVILETIFRQLNMEIPWNYWSIMDLRTFKRFVAEDKKLPDAEHHALGDARLQAKFVIENYKKVKNER